MAIPQNFIQDLLSRADVVEIVGRHVQLKKGGANFLGLCPFHGEKTPSFTVSPAKQFYHCFGCGKNGNAIGFLMDYAGMNFVEAVKDLAGQYGMQVPEDDTTPAERARAAEQRQKQATLTDVLEKAGAAYRKHLKDSPRAIDYLKSRGLSGEIARQFGLGYAPEGWRNLASVFPEYDDPLLAESGLVIVNAEEDKRYDRFRDRVMFPIRNVKGECIGFGGRVLGDGTPKYLNSPETPVFSKGRELYGLYEARNALHEQGYVLVTEGYMDVVALAQLGFPNAVATLGTACTPEHVHKLFRFTDHVVFSFDGDAAGRRAARKALDGALPYATDVRTVKFLFLPPEHDPDSYIRAHGREAFARYVAEATPLSIFLIETAREGCDLAAPEGRARLAANARPLWEQLPEGALKRQVLNALAEAVQEDPRDLLAAWAPASRRPEGGGRARQNRPTEPRGWTRRTPSLPSVEANARNVARLLLPRTAWWDELSVSEHELLCGLEGTLGELFRWLDAQAHEHGAQPLAALQAAWQGQPFQALAEQLMALDAMQPLGRVVEDPEVDHGQLRRLMLALRVDVLGEMLKEVQALPPTDPTRSQRQAELIQEQFSLKRQQMLLKSPANHIM
jgi:DNA primase